FNQSKYFKPVFYTNMQEAKLALQSKQVNAIIRLREDFSRQVFKPQPAAIQTIVNGVDANTARLISGYVQSTWSQWINHQSELRGVPTHLPVIAEHRIWYNSAVLSKDYLIPGLIAVIMTLIGALLTALVFAREWERGTMEALLATPISTQEILLGKLIPYYILGMGGLILSITMAVFLFEIPLRGSLWVLLLTGSLFLFVALGMGLLISIVAKNQFVAGQIAIIVTFLPAFIMSGFIFDISSMPTAIQMFTYLIGARYFVAILQTVFLTGNIWAVILPNALALLIMALIFFGLAASKAPKRLE
ncbi:MAG: ABC transporter permease subunit, partial [Methylococcales bacterium]